MVIKMRVFYLFKIKEEFVSLYQETPGVLFQIYPHFVERMAKFYQENQQIQNCDIALLGDSLVEMMETKYFSL